MKGALMRGRVGKRVVEGYDVPFEVVPGVEDLIVSRVTEIDGDARAIDAIITRQMLPSSSRELLGRLMRRETLAKVRVDVRKSEFAYSLTRAGPRRRPCRGEIPLAPAGGRHPR